MNGTYEIIDHIHRLPAVVTMQFYGATATVFTALLLSLLLSRAVKVNALIYEIIVAEINAINAFVIYHCDNKQTFNLKLQVD